MKRRARFRCLSQVRKRRWCLVPARTYLRFFLRALNLKMRVFYSVKVVYESERRRRLVLCLLVKHLSANLLCAYAAAAAVCTLRCKI